MATGPPKKKRPPYRKKKTRTQELNLSPEEVLDRFTDGPHDGVFTDGACTGNPGPGGWGFVWVEDNQVKTCGHGHDAQTTNNRMELQALIAAYKVIPKDAKVTLYSDSNLCVRTLNEWAANWQRMGWKRKTGPVENLELVQEAYTLHKAHPKCTLKWIKAHNGSRWNEYADSLATTYVREKEAKKKAAAKPADEAEDPAPAAKTGPDDEPSDEVGRWRADTPGAEEQAHLNNAGAALMPRPVVDALRAHLDLEARIGGYEAAEKRRGAVEETYAQVARLLNVRARQVALVDSATTAIAQVLSAIPFERGDVLLTTRLDYASNQIMALSLAQRCGIEVVWAPDLPEGGVDPDAAARLVHGRRPKLVMVTQMPTSSGVLQRVTPIAAACREAGVPLLLDACQTVGQLPVDFEKLGCDFLAASARKFLRGPRGCGFLAVSKEALKKGYQPLLPDLRGAEWTADDVFRPSATARRFETWDFAYALVLGLGEAARYANGLDLRAVARRVQGLAGRLRERLAAVDGVRALDRGTWLGAIATFAVDGWDDPAELVAGLRERRVHASISHRSSAVREYDEKGVAWALRFSPHYYNTEDEVDVAVDAVADLQKQ